LVHDDTNKINIFRKRTADNILKSKIFTGCSDKAIAFVALARASGIPSRLVETIIGGNKQDSHHGHIFVDIKISNKWYLFDPRHGFTKNNKPYLAFTGITYKLLAKGPDFNNMFIRYKNGKYKNSFVKILSPSDIIKYKKEVGI
jgi:transglutaminase-like putative cysteine protease